MVKAKRRAVRKRPAHRSAMPHRRLAVDEWARRHKVAPFLAILAQQVVGVADPAIAMMEHLRAGNLDRLLPARPDWNAWRQFYRRHRVLLHGVGDAFPEFCGSGHDALRELNQMNKAAIEAQTEPEKVVAAMRVLPASEWANLIREAQWEMDLVYQAHLEDVREELAGGEDESTDDFDRRVGEFPALHFAIRVLLVSFVEFEAHPLFLLRDAGRLEDSNDPAIKLQAIERLLRIDGTLMQEPRIWRWVQGGRSAVRRERERSAGRWVAEGIRGPVSRIRVKQSLAALISCLSERINLRIVPPNKVAARILTARQLNELFDAWQQDMATYGRVPRNRKVDPDIRDQCKAWQKGIQRHKKLWRWLVQPR